MLGILEDIKSCTNEERDIETGHTGTTRRRILDASGISVLAGQVIQTVYSSHSEYHLHTNDKRGLSRQALVNSILLCCWCISKRDLTYFRNTLHNVMPPYTDVYVFSLIHSKNHTAFRTDKKVQFILDMVMKAQRRSSDISLKSVLLVDGGRWSTTRPGRFTPGKGTRYAFYRRLGGPQGRSGRVRKISPATQIRSPDRAARSV